MHTWFFSYHDYLSFSTQERVLFPLPSVPFYMNKVLLCQKLCMSRETRHKNEIITSTFRPDCKELFISERCKWWESDKTSIHLGRQEARYRTKTFSRDNFTLKMKEKFYQDIHWGVLMLLFDCSIRVCTLVCVEEVDGKAGQYWQCKKPSTVLYHFTRSCHCEIRLWIESWNGLT